MSHAAGPFHDAGLGAAAAAARADWQADEEHWSAAALEQFRHGRTLPEIARDHLHRGDTIALHWPGCAISVTGRVIGVADDAVAVATIDGRIDAYLPTNGSIAWRIVERAAQGGSRGLALGSFRSRLLELEAVGDAVDVALAGDDTLTLQGSLHVGRDHVLVASPEGEWVAALSALRWVRAAAPA